MATLTERDYAKLAAAAADDLVMRKIALNDSIEKLASDYGMNEDQLARLCEATNNAAFNAVFADKGKAGSADRLVDFDVASPKAILQRKLAQARSAMNKAASAEPGFDSIWESRPLAAPALEGEKTAASNEYVPDAARLERIAARDARSVTKALEHLRIEKIAAAQQRDEAVERLYFHFRPVERRAQFATFEKDAMALHGAAADSLLDELRWKLGMPAVSRNHSKLANYVVVSDSASEYKFFARAVKAASDIVDIGRVLDAHSA